MRTGHLDGDGTWKKSQNYVLILWQVATNPHTVKVKDGETIKDYDGDAFSDANLRRVIYQAYHLYKVRWLCE